MANSGVNPEVLAKEIIKDLGGKDNLISAVYCMTRLRIVVADMGKIDKKSIKETEGVLGYAEQGNQAQIILGPGRVTKVAQIVADITGIKLGEANEAEVRKSEINAKNDTAFKRVLKKISNIFIPLIPAFIACGLVISS